MVVLRLPDSWSNWNLKMLVFEERGKPGVLGEKPLGAKERTNNKTNIKLSPTYVLLIFSTALRVISVEFPLIERFSYDLEKLFP